MNYYEDIDWYAGLLIKPQHLQSIKRCNYNNFWYIFSQYMKNCYGVLHFQYDTSMIHNGIIKIIRLDAVLSDGTILSVDQNDQEFLNLSFNLLEQIPSDNKEHILYLAVTRYKTTNVSNVERYYKCTVGPIVDELNTEEEEYLYYFKVRPYILGEDNIMPKHCYIPLFLAKNVKGTINIVEEIYPVMFVNKDNIGKHILKIISKLKHKLEVFYDKISNAIYENTIDANTIIYMRNYDLVNNVVSRIEYKLQYDNIPASVMYTELCELNNCIYIVMNTKSINLPVFEVSKMHSVYIAILNVIDANIDYIFNVNISFIKFQPISDDTLSACLDAKYIIEEKIIIECKLDANLPVLYSEIEYDVKNIIICSKNKMVSTINMRVTGAERQIIKDMNSIKNLIGHNLSNSILLSISSQDKFIDIEHDIVIVMDRNLLNKYQFSLIYIK